MLLDVAGIIAYMRHAEGFPPVAVAMNTGDKDGMAGSLAYDTYTQAEVSIVGRKGREIVVMRGERWKKWGRKRWEGGGRENVCKFVGVQHQVPSTYQY